MAEQSKIEEMLIALAMRIEKLEASMLGEPLEEIYPPKREEKKKKQSKPLNERVLKAIEQGKYISKTELVYIAKTLGYSASGVMDVEDIVAALKGASVHWFGDPWEREREETHVYVRENNIAVSLIKCDLNCPECPDHRISMCWTENGDVIQKYHREQET